MRTDTELVQFAYNAIREMEREVRDTFWSEFKLTTIKFQFGVRRNGKHRRSWGGYDAGFRKGQAGGKGGYVELALARYRPSRRIVLGELLNDDKIDFAEYKHIKRDPVIGELKGVSRKKAILAIVAHEVAHAFEHTAGMRLSGFVSGEPVKELLRASTVSSSFVARNSGGVKGHGPVWQKMYAHLRVKFVNHLS